MPAFYKIDKERRLMMSTASGIITMAESLAHRENLLKDPDFDASFGQLLDATHVTDVRLTPEDIRTLALIKVFSANSRRAILVNSDLKFGLARMFAVFRDGLGEDSPKIGSILRFLRV